MSHELAFTQNGKAMMAYVGEVPWHGLGTKVEEVMTAEQAIEAAGLGWEVELLDMFADHPTFGTLGVEGSFRVTRNDTGDQLGVVGSRYEPIQNVEAFTFFDRVIDKGQANYHTAGALNNGSRVWLLADLGSAMELPVEDEIHKFALLSTSHNGAQSLEMMLTPIRVVCANTLSFAVLGAENRTRIRHTASAKDKLSNEDTVQEVRRILGLVENYDKIFTETMTTLLDADMTVVACQDFLENLFPDNEECENNSRTENIRSDILDLFDGAGAGLDVAGVRGTRYAALNAVAEYADHFRCVRATGTKTPEEARLESIWFGSAGKVKDQALQLLL